MRLGVAPLLLFSGGGGNLGTTEAAAPEGIIGMSDLDAILAEWEQDRAFRFWCAVYWLPYQVARLWYKAKGWVRC